MTSSCNCATFLECLIVDQHHNIQASMLLRSLFNIIGLGNKCHPTPPRPLTIYGHKCTWENFDRNFRCAHPVTVIVMSYLGLLFVFCLYLCLSEILNLHISRLLSPLSEVGEYPVAVTSFLLLPGKVISALPLLADDDEGGGVIIDSNGHHVSYPAR